MTEIDAISLLARLESAFDKRLSDGARLEYLSKMVKWPFEVGEKAVEMAIEQCRFFPKIADLVGFLPGVETGRPARYEDGIDWSADLGKLMDYRNERIRNLPRDLYNAFLIQPEVEDSYEKAIRIEFNNAKALQKDAFDYFFIEHEPGKPTREQVWVSRARSRLKAAMANMRPVPEFPGKGNIQHLRRQFTGGGHDVEGAAGNGHAGEGSLPASGSGLGNQMQTIGAHLAHYATPVEVPGGDV